MMEETQMVQQIELNQIQQYIKPEVKEFIKHDLKLAVMEGEPVLEIKMDIFRLSHGLEDGIKLIVMIRKKLKK